VKPGRAAFVSVDGLDPAAVLATARAALGSRARGGISHWDASGVFQELAVANEAAGIPSARTLLLLYAADLAFRLRWEIRPTLADGRSVVAAPYVDTAVAFGRAAGLKAGWLANLFRFVPRPTERRFAPPGSARAGTITDGFIGFSCDRMGIEPASAARRRLVEDATAELRRASRR
jgi:hypothetical protein